MKIESIEVIPMNKESIFESEELNIFECVSITTSYDEWKVMHDKHLEMIGYIPDRSTKSPYFDEICEEFAKNHKAFMTAPTAKFGNEVYEAKTRVAETEEELYAFEASGPLYSVLKVFIENTEAGKIVERRYVDRESFKQKYGLWYPLKSIYKIRYGVKS